MMSVKKQFIPPGRLMPALILHKFVIGSKVCGKHKIILVLHKLEKSGVHRLRGVHITVDIDVTASVRPEFFRCTVRIKSPGVHIVKAVLCFKIGKVLVEPLTVIYKACRSRKSCASPDDHRVGSFKGVFQSFHLF